MKIFVTGATGNVGIAVVRELLRLGYDVTTLTRGGEEVPGCRVVIGDLNNLEPLRADIQSADGIIHLASPRDDERRSVLWVDIAGTGALLDWWSRGNFIYASSQTVYGIPSAPLTEESAIDALCWYDWGRVSNEFQLRVAAIQRSHEPGAAISLRLGLLFSDGPRRHDRQFLHDIHSHLLHDGVFLFDSEAALEDAGSSFLGDGDAGRGIVRALQVRLSRPYNLASGFCTWKELLESFARYTGRSPRIEISAAWDSGDQMRLPASRSVLDATAFTRDGDFRPEQDLDELVGRFVRATAP